MKRFIGIVLAYTLSFCAHGQDCRRVDSVKGKSTGIEIEGGMVFSKDFYSLLIRKHLVSSDSTHYTLLLYATSKTVLSDSLLQSEGELALFFSDGTVEILDANCFNDGLIGTKNIVGFHVEVAGFIIRKIYEAPIFKIRAYGILETEFSSRKQKQQKRIANCLLNK